jgi:hypothetical protein
MLAEVIGAGGFVQLFVHNDCVVPARSGPGFDPLGRHGRARERFAAASSGLRPADVADAPPRNLVCRGYGTSRSDG